jgi:hypothetical protein
METRLRLNASRQSKGRNHARPSFCRFIFLSSGSVGCTP